MVTHARLQGKIFTRDADASKSSFLGQQACYLASNGHNSGRQPVPPLFSMNRDPLSARHTDDRQRVMFGAKEGENGFRHGPLYGLRSVGMLSERFITQANMGFMSDSQPSTCSRHVSSTEGGSFFFRVRDGLRRRWRRLVIEIASRTGRYDRWKAVEWERVERLVFICSGNICRSPYAEAVAIRRGLDAISFGTTASGGAPADPVAIEVAKRVGIDLRKHRSRRFNDHGIRASDLLVIMDTSHLTSTRLVAESVGAQTTLLGLWDGGQPVVIWDPFGQPADKFEACFQRIDSCMGRMQHAWAGNEHV